MSKTHPKHIMVMTGATSGIGHKPSNSSHSKRSRTKLIRVEMQDHPVALATGAVCSDWLVAFAGCAPVLAH